MRSQNLVSKEPAILDFYCEELDLVENEIASIFDNSSTIRRDYGNLVVDINRRMVPHETQESNKIKTVIYPTLIEICKILINSDPKRYPIRTTIEEFCDPKKIGFGIYIDGKGFSMPWHLDNRTIVLSGIINLKDNSTKTGFAPSDQWWMDQGRDLKDNKIIHLSQNKKYHGTAWLNTELTWHCVPYVEEERRILMFNLNF